MDIGYSFAKYALFLFNFLFAVLGIAMVVIGIGVKVKFGEYHDFVENNLTAYLVMLIIAGFAVFFIAYLGCCGAIKENTCLLCMYSMIMIVLVVFEIGLIHRAYSNRNQLETDLGARLNSTLQQAGKNPALYASWDFLQNNLQCCGSDGPQDWNNVLPGKNLPGSCCGKAANDLTCNQTEAIQTGCKSALTSLLKSNLAKVVGVAVSAILLQLLLIIFPCCLFSAIRRNERLPRRWQRF